MTNEETTEEVLDDSHKQAAEQILVSYHNAQKLAGDTKDNGRKAVDEALRCGVLLNAKKEEIGHGGWLKWLDVYVPELHYRTAQVWMRLAAKTNHDSYLKSANSLRQAYIAVGILPDPVKGQRKRIEGQSKPLKSSNGDTYLALFHELFAEKAIENLIQTNDFGSWQTTELELAIRTIEPLTLVRNRMAYALQQKLTGAEATIDVF